MIYAWCSRSSVIAPSPNVKVLEVDDHSERAVKQEAVDDDDEEGEEEGMKGATQGDASLKEAVKETQG